MLARPVGGCLTVLLASFLASGCGGGTTAATPAPGANQGGAAPVDGPPAVRAKRVRGIPDVAVYREVGSVRADRTVSIAAEVAGRVVRVRYEVGEAVEAAAPGARGPVVVEVDPASYELALKRAEAGLEAARARTAYALRDRDRVAGLMKRETAALSEADLDRAENALALAQAEERGADVAVAEAKLALERTRIEAAPGYRIASRLVEPGDYVVPGRTVVQALDDRSVRVDFDVPGERLAVLEKGTRVPFTVKELKDRRFEGEVLFRGPRADERSRRFPVELRVENADGTLRPGMVAVVSVSIARSGRALSVVPREAVGQRLEERYVLVLVALGSGGGEGGGAERLARVERRHVDLLDIPDLDPALLAVDGVSAGELVAVDAVARLRTGDAVRVVEEAP